MINKNSIYNNSIICDMGCGEGGSNNFLEIPNPYHLYTKKMYKINGVFKKYTLLTL